MQGAADEMSGIGGVLLAAGSSRRFGADKQSALVGDAPLLTLAARLLLDAGLTAPIVVLGPRAEEHRALLAGLPLRIVENPNATSGMASSLAAGVAAAGDCDAVVVTVCDQPAVTAAHLRALGRAWRASGRSIVASSYGGTRGVPALFAAAHFAALRGLTGDRGAGPLLAQHAADLLAIPLAGGEVDIDTPADLDHFRYSCGL